MSIHTYKGRNMKKLVVLVVLAAMLAAFVQSAKCEEIKEVLKGKVAPLTLQLKDLNGDWWRLNVGSFTAENALMSFYASLAGGAAGGGGSYTQGETLKLGGETFLITYQVEAKPVNYRDLMRSSEPPKPEKLTPETKLTLALLNMRMTASLSGIKPFDLEQEIKRSENAGVEVEEQEATVQSLSNLKNLALAVLMCIDDYDDVIPDIKTPETAKEQLKPYVGDEKILTNPVTKMPYQFNAILAGKKIAHISDPASMVVIYEDSPAPDGTRGAAFLDGHAKRIKESDWPAIKKASKIP
jgi:hypothetical protein